jgi:hypothetical protein
VFNRASVCSVKREKSAKKGRRDRRKSGLTNHRSRHSMNRRPNEHYQESTIRDSNHKHLKSPSPLVCQLPSGSSSSEASNPSNFGTRSLEQFPYRTAPSNPQYTSRWIALHIFPELDGVIRFCTKGFRP